MFDPTKPVNTRSGLQVRIVCTDMKLDKHPILALVTDGGKEYTTSYRIDGRVAELSYNHPMDLVNIPEGRYVNIYNVDLDTGLQSLWIDELTYSSRNSADMGNPDEHIPAGATRIACINLNRLPSLFDD
jgi:hypothetical protein